LSPILVRPVREQLEHDRVIRLLQAKYKRKFDVAINPGNEQGTPVPIGLSPWYPDLVLHSTERNRKLVGVVEVETVESINHLEAMSQWAAFARLKTQFHLYVPAAMVDVARRFCSDLNISVTEIWAYHAIGEQIRFTAVQRAPGSEDNGTVATREPRRSKGAAADPKTRAASARPAAKTTAKAAPKVSAKPGRRAVVPVRKPVARQPKAVRPLARPAAKKSTARPTKRK
jgi:hypothetical protein